MRGSVKGPGSIVSSSLTLTNAGVGNNMLKVAKNNENGNGMHSSSGVSSATSASSGGEDEEPKSMSKSKKSDSVSVSSSLRTRHLKQRAKEYAYKDGSDDSVENGGEPIYQGIIERDISVIRREAEMNSLKSDLDLLRGDLERTRRALFAAQDTEQALKNELAEAKKRSNTLERMATSAAAKSKATTSSEAAELIKRYGELYAQMRLETLDALDKMAELVNSEELKNKLLFSVVVLAFRSVTSTVEAKREQVRRILQIPPVQVDEQDLCIEDSEGEQRKAAAELEQAISAYMRRATRNFDLSKNVEVSSNFIQWTPLIVATDIRSSRL